MTKPNINVEHFLDNCEDIEAIIEFWNHTKSIKTLNNLKGQR